jgi:hypothetical protein
LLRSLLAWWLGHLMRCGADLRGWLVREQQKLVFLSGLGVMSEMGVGLMMSVLSAEGEV